jgi:heme exporter protein A
VQSGETLALFGSNGAGKTTLLRLLGGLLKPSGGSAKVGGEKVPGGAAVRRQIGLISHHTLLYDALTARENVEFFARLYGVSSPGEAAAQSLERMRIADRADTPVRALSRGMKQRVSIARATVHNPTVVLADEPFTGLDTSGARALADLLAELRSSGAALVLVTHNIDEGLSLATHAAVMHRGKLIRSGSRASIDESKFAAEYRELVAADE